MNEENIGPSGVEGTYGPNDTGGMCIHVRRAAKELKSACWSVVGYSHSGCVTRDHPLVIALNELRKLDEKYIQYANEKHDPSLFEPDPECFVTPEEYWRPYQGLPGENVLSL